jgi:Tol biopolymer transport system component
MPSRHFSRFTSSLLVAAFTLSVVPVAHADADAEADGGQVPSWRQPGWVARENAKAGTVDWQITRDGPDTPPQIHQKPANSDAVRGYASATSVNIGDSVTVFVSSATTWRLEAYRMGYYQDLGARWVWTSEDQPAFAQSDAVIDPVTNMREARWEPSLTFSTSPSAADFVPGDYLLKLISELGASYIPISVRDDGSTSDLAIVHAVTTWQAYNKWGGASHYSSDGVGSFSRSSVVSFDRPYQSSGAGEYLLREYGATYLAERLGLDVTYMTTIDLDINPARAMQHRGLIMPGHDEYHTSATRQAFLDARDGAGVNLAFLGSNGVYRRIRFSPSPLGERRRQENYRVAADDKGAASDPEGTATTFPAAGKPTSQVIGTEFNCVNATEASIPVRRDDVVTSKDQIVYDESFWALAGTGLRNGDVMPGFIGHEVDFLAPNLATPGPVQLFFRSPIVCKSSGAVSSGDAGYYTMPSGAGVIASGTLHWMMHVTNCITEPDSTDRCRNRQIIANILQRFAAGPAGLTHPSVDNAQRNPAPAVNLAVTSATSDWSEQMTFTAKVTDGHGPLRYRFRFGDGNEVVTDTATVTHTYAAPGRYAASVVVSTASSSTVANWVVWAGSRQPAAFIETTQTTASAGQPVTFMLHNNVAGGDKVTWDFGDGDMLPGAAIGRHSFTAPGTYQVRALVQSAGGAAVTAPVTITITATPSTVAPFAVATASTTRPTDVSGDGRYVAFTSSAGVVPGVAGGVSQVYRTDTATKTTVLVSSDDTGLAGSHTSDSPRITPDGRYVVFSSDARNLVVGDTNGRRDTFRKDMATGAVVRVSTAHLTNAQVAGTAHALAVSDDGRYVLMWTGAGDYRPGHGDQLATYDKVYRKDLTTGETALVSASATGVRANSFSQHGDMSADGRWVAFQSSSTNLAGAGTSGAMGMFVKDMLTGSIARADVGRDGTIGAGSSTSPRISADGRYVAFASAKTNLVAGDTNRVTDIFWYDTATKSMSMVSSSVDGAMLNGASSVADISASGDRVAYLTTATNFNAATAAALASNAVAVMADMVTGDVVWASPAAGATVAGAAVRAPAVSGDGSRVAFISGGARLPAGVIVNRFPRQEPATRTADHGSAASVRPVDVSATGRFVVFVSTASVVPGVPSGVAQVYRTDMATGSTVLVSSNAAGVPGDLAADSPRITADGRFVIFSADARNLVPGDTNARRDTFRKDLSDGSVVRASTAHRTNNQVAATSHAIAVSDDGRYVMMWSGAGDFRPGSNDQLAAYDKIYRKDLDTGDMVLVSASASGVTANSFSQLGDLSADGQVAVFQSTATNLTPGASGATMNIFVKNLTTGAVTMADSVGGVAPAGASAAPRLSSDGRWVVFVSAKDGLTANDTNRSRDVFRFDRVSGARVRMSESVAGTVASTQAATPSISDSGELAVFVTSSAAGQLVVVASSDGRGRVFTRRSSGALAAGSYAGPLLSGDGRTVAVVSGGTALSGAAGVHVGPRP